MTHPVEVALSTYCLEYRNWSLVWTDDRCEELPGCDKTKGKCAACKNEKALCCPGNRNQQNKSQECTEPIADAINIRFNPDDGYFCVVPKTGGNNNILLLRNNYVMISDHGHENSQFDVFDHPDVQFIMIMRRYPLFYNAFLITPCLLISFLTALVYYLPCASHQKITFCTSVLLGKSLK